MAMASMESTDSGALVTKRQIPNPRNLNIEEPRYDQNTFSGRAKHFFIVANPLNLFLTDDKLEKAKTVIEKYRAGNDLKRYTDDEIWKFKHHYDSAFHPDTGEKMVLIGRMSAQVPMNMTITGCMMTFYRTTPAVLFWQWINQSFNAIVNYTNRSGDKPIGLQRLGLSYVLATGGAVTTAVGLNSLVKKFPPIIGRFVPFTAVAAANCINIPFMRSREITHGVPIFDEKGEKLGESTAAAKKAIFQVTCSRVAMATPGMMIPPFIMQYLEKKSFLRRKPTLNAPIQVGLVGIFLIFATPLCCALFPQKSSISVSSLESEVRAKVESLPSHPQIVYFNKGL